MNEHPIVLFDGVCNLCNKSVQFIIRHDQEKKFRFGSLQGEAAKRILSKAGLNTDELSTLLLVEGDKIYMRSTAVLRIAKRLGGFWKLGYAAIIIPRFLRDAVYNVVAKKRYKWFGRKQECMVPSAEVKGLFLE